MNLQVVLERETDGVAHQRRADRDLDLLDALRRREPMAAECLVTRYGERAYRLARRITGNGQDAEEVVQDAFWTVVRKRSEEHTSELQSQSNLVCRLLLEKKKKHSTHSAMIRRS